MQHMRSNVSRTRRKNEGNFWLAFSSNPKVLNKKTKNQVNTNVPKPPCRSMQKEGFWTWKTFKKLPEKESFAPPKKPNLALCHQFSGVAQLLLVFREDPSKTPIFNQKHCYQDGGKKWSLGDFSTHSLQKNGWNKNLWKIHKSIQLTNSFSGGFRQLLQLKVICVPTFGRNCRLGPPVRAAVQLLQIVFKKGQFNQLRGGLWLVNKCIN